MFVKCLSTLVLPSLKQHILSLSKATLNNTYSSTILVGKLIKDIDIHVNVLFDRFAYPKYMSLAAAVKYHGFCVYLVGAMPQPSLALSFTLS